jgi:hypothetical protein
MRRTCASSRGAPPSAAFELLTDPGAEAEAGHGAVHADRQASRGARRAGGRLSGGTARIVAACPTTSAAPTEAAEPAAETTEATGCARATESTGCTDATRSTRASQATGSASSAVATHAAGSTAEASPGASERAASARATEVSGSTRRAPRAGGSSASPTARCRARFPAGRESARTAAACAALECDACTALTHEPVRARACIVTGVRPRRRRGTAAFQADEEAQRTEESGTELAISSHLFGPLSYRAKKENLPSCAIVYAIKSMRSFRSACPDSGLGGSSRTAGSAT